jgi:uncharacterized OB-fold protein
MVSTKLVNWRCRICNNTRYMQRAFCEDCHGAIEELLYKTRSELKAEIVRCELALARMRAALEG